MGNFSETRWSLVQRATTNNQALDSLCRSYRPAVVAWFTRQRIAREEAEDLTQSFFTHLLEKNTLDHADPERGRFRTFLLTSVRNFYLNELERRTAKKRGGHVFHAPLSGDESDNNSPERAFDRDFVAILLSKAMRALEDEAIASGKGDLFRKLRPYVAERPDSEDYARLSGELDMRKNTIAVAVHRLRQKLKAQALEELRDTVASDECFAKELHELRHALR